MNMFPLPISIWYKYFQKISTPLQDDSLWPELLLRLTDTAVIISLKTELYLLFRDGNFDWNKEHFCFSSVANELLIISSS